MPHAPNRRESKRALLIGLGISAAIHVLAFLFLRLDIVVAPEEPVVTFDPVPTPVAVQTVTTPFEAQVQGGVEGAPGAAGPAAPETGAASAPVAEVPDVGNPLLAKADEEVAAAEISVDAPAVALEVVPVALPEAGAPAEPNATPVYVPGSVGAAKRGWAEEGLGSGRNGNGPGFLGGIGIGIGDPHCPMPGRGRGRPIVPPRSR